VYRQLLAERRAVADRQLILNNFMVVLALAGHCDEALHIGYKVEREIRDLRKDDAYYRYFVQTNMAGLFHLSGRRSEGEQLWHELETRVPTIPQEDRPYLVERQQLQLDAFAEVATGDAAGWHDYLQRKHPVMLGDGWRFFGRGFLLSDIQFWSES
jgi:hypothetical protein